MANAGWGLRLMNRHANTAKWPGLAVDPQTSAARSSLFANVRILSNANDSKKQPLMDGGGPPLWGEGRRRPPRAQLPCRSRARTAPDDDE